LIHIVGGSVALIAGAGGLIATKGGRWHAGIGTIFFGAMLVMGLTGAVVAALKPERGTTVIGILTCYLVVTSWSAARRRDGRPGPIELGGLVVALGCVTALVLLGLSGLSDPRGRVDSLPWQVHFVFGALVALAAALDLNFILRGQLSGVQRIGRHLWRMATALLIATTSFFQGQQDEFPEAWQGAFIWSLPGYAVLAAMLFWIVRVRFGKGWRKWPPGERVSRAPASSPPAQDPI
jgi:hypothetical protein